MRLGGHAARRGAAGIGAAGAAAVLLVGCGGSTPLPQHSPQVTVSAAHVGTALSEVRIAHGNTLSLRPSATTAPEPSATTQPSASAPGQPRSGAETNSEAGTRSGAGTHSEVIRQRALAEIATDAHVDPPECAVLRDATVSVLAEPEPGATARRAVSTDRRTAVTVDLVENETAAEAAVAELEERVGTCDGMRLTSAGVSLQVRFTPVPWSGPGTLAEAHTRVLGEPVAAAVSRTHLGNAVVTVSHLDTDVLGGGATPHPPAPREHMVRETEVVTDAVLDRLREAAVAQ